MAAPGGDRVGLDALLAPRSVAVVGASSDPTRIGGRPIAYMRARGFRGAILPVNPNRREVQGLTAYESVASLPEVPDVAIVAVAGAASVEAVASLAARGTGAAIVFTAGFAETGAAGAAAQAALLEAAGGMRLLGPNSLGAFNDRIGFYGIFSSSLESGYPPPGRVAVVSQSGAYGTHLFATARDRGLGTPLCVTTGNEADVTVGELVLWLVDDPGTDVIAVYAEGIRDGATFVAALEAARCARKPVVVMKVGRSRLGASAARSHTASIAGDDAVTGAVLEEFGAIRARSTEEMLDIAYLATRRIYPAGNTLGVITVSGGAGVLVSDAAEQLDLAMPPMPAAAQDALRALIPFAAPANPVDCTAQVFNDMGLVGRFAESMVVDGGYASVLAFFSQVGGAASIAPRLRAELAAVRARHPERLFVLSVLAGPDYVAGYEADGFFGVRRPDARGGGDRGDGASRRCVRRPRPARPPAALPPPELPPRSPDEAQTKRILALAGIPSLPERVCVDADAAAAAAAALGYPAVMKLLSPDIAHKTEIGGVLLGLADAEAVRAGFALLLARGRAVPGARIGGVLVSRQVEGAVECILGVHRDPVFGAVAMFGIGGVFVEVLRDVAFRRCPFGPAEAERMIRSIRAAPLLLGARGRPCADIAALADMLSSLSRFADAAGPRLLSVEMNPVMALPEGKGAFAADAAMTLAA